MFKKSFRFTAFLAFSLSSLVLISSCQYFEKFRNNNQKPQIRLVGLDGKPSKIVTRVPELNQQYVNSPENHRAPIIMESNRGTQLMDNPSQQQYNYNSPKSYVNTPQNSQTFNVNSQNNAAKEDVIQYDLNEAPTKKQSSTTVAKPEEKKSNTKYSVGLDKAEQQKPTKIIKKSAKSKTRQKGSYYAQVGAFSSESSAKTSLEKMSKFHKGIIETRKGKKTLYRVLLGPFNTASSAQSVIRKIKKSGHDAILVR